MCEQGIEKDGWSSSFLFYNLSRLCSFLELKESVFEEPIHFYVGLLIL